MNFSGEQDMQTISSAAQAHHLQTQVTAVDAWKMDAFARFLPEAGVF
jgi:hypothetical protein